MYGQVAQFFSERKEPEGSCGWGLVELEESLAVTSKSARRLEERLMLEIGSDGLKVVIKGIRVGLLTSIVCKATLRGKSAARCVCLVTKFRL